MDEKKTMTICLIFLSLISFFFVLSASCDDRGIKRIRKDKENRYALVIGNNRYKDAPLNNPVNDARDIASVLEKLDFEVSLKENAGIREMEKAIRTFGKKIRKGGVGLFYFSGHGLQLNGENFLIPIDADIQEEFDIKYEAVNAGKLLDMMYDSENKLNIVILDACRNNPFDSKGYKGIPFSSGLARMDAPYGTLIAYATSPGDVASDGSGKNSIYTKYLLKYISVKGLTVEQVFKKVRNSVMKESNKKQVPWESTSLTGGDFCFNGCFKNTERLVWEMKQRDMKKTYDQITSFQDKNIRTRIGLWKMFLDTFSDDNPYSKDDDIMRTDATNGIASLERELYQSLSNQKMTKKCYVVTNVGSDDVLNVREKPDHNSPKIGEIPCNGQDVMDLEQKHFSGSSLWAKIQYGLIVGWVNSTYLEITNDCDLPTYENLSTSDLYSNTQSNNDAIHICFKVIKVKEWDVLNMREKPYYKSRKVGEIPSNGKSIFYLNEKHTLGSGEKWLKVQYNNYYGWVNSKYLKPIKKCGE